MKMAHERSAGVLVLMWTKTGWKYLTLVTSMIDKEGARKLDFPKGHVESGEDWIEAAIRETKEEAGISETELDFTWGDQHIDCYRTGKVCRMFIASTAAKPRIAKNPESGRFEHIGWQWLDLEQDMYERRIHPYIRPAVEWGRSIVLGRQIDSAHVHSSQPERSKRER
jgi:bis(5'-nucleosidyl)-tetraphosphatase